MPRFPKWPFKDPNETLDYQIDWSERLDEGDTISLSAWTADVGLTASNPSATDTTTTIWLSGGTAGERYNVHNRVTTVGGRIMDQTMEIEVRER